MREKIFDLFHPNIYKKNPIILNIYSQEYLDIKIIDLPVISRIPIVDSPSNEKMISIKITKEYIKENYSMLYFCPSCNVTSILCL